MKNCKTIYFNDLGQIEYKKAWELQERLFNGLLAQKTSISASETETTGHLPNYLLFCEHPHVFTLGKHGLRDNLLLKESELHNISASFYQTDRGGDITYHGTGQLVVYPIFDLDNYKLEIKRYISALEEIIIRTLADYGISGSRLQEASGVWIDAESEHSARKICAVGVRVSKKITMHGLALNINTDLRYFSYIIPCGISNKGVTSMQHELSQLVNMNDVKQTLKYHISQVFDAILIQEGLA